MNKTKERKKGDKNRENDEDFVSRSMVVKKKKISTADNCLVHCRVESCFDEIISFTEVSWKVSKI